MTYLVAIVTVNSIVVAQYRIDTTVTIEELWNPLVLWEYRTFWIKAARLNSKSFCSLKASLLGRKAQTLLVPCIVTSYGWTVLYEFSWWCIRSTFYRCTTGLSAIWATGYRLWLPTDLTEQTREKVPLQLHPRSLQPCVQLRLFLGKERFIYTVHFIQSKRWSLSKRGQVLKNLCISPWLHVRITWGAEGGRSLKKMPMPGAPPQTSYIRISRIWFPDNSVW